jgi:hypothetical protein
MAATESRTGFRLPWSTEEKATGQRADAPQDADRPSDAERSEASAEAPTESVVEAPTPDTTAEPAAAEPAPEPLPTGAVEFEEVSVQPTATPEATIRPQGAAPKKPTKFLADLTRAMQAAAEASRASTLEQFQGEAKSHIEQVHARSADEAAELRKTADDDIVTIRDWSKAELARIREETERKITTRKSDLDVELEEHAARIEREIERVQTRVAGFEAEMDKFFQRLLTEDDPAEFAAMAENLPEPPPFDFDHDDDWYTPTAVSVETVAEVETVAVETVAEVETVAVETVAEVETVAVETVAEVEQTTGQVETTTAETDGDTLIGSAETVSIGDLPTTEGDDVAYAVQDDPAEVEAAMAAIEAAYRAADPPETETVTPDADDPRLAALGLAPDLDAAEAEAAAAAAETSDDEIPTMGDDALAARLAGLVPEGTAAPTPRPAAPKAAATSQVVVTGLISVASIASFKRHLGRISGVQSVGVSSGPDGEFVFKVAHGAEVVLADAIPSLPGFEARVTGTGDGVVNVSARDRESEG